MKGLIFIKDEIYWIWLQHSLSQGSSKIRTVLRLFKDAKNFYEAGPKEWRLCGCFTKRELAAFDTFSLKQAEDVMSRCKYLGIDVVTFADESYPERLREISNPPCVIYVKGELPKVDDRITIGIVGTRSATAYGFEMAYKISNELSKVGAVIVSGGALGIDSCAHKGALSANGKTILVMGCGINYRYLMENAQMRKLIYTSNGALISEYPPDSPSIPRNFPMRNRIISGLSLGVLVVEAGEKSGSLITANLALEQNRDLFAVPGNINSSVSMGTNKLIKECAKPITCANDILEEYSHMLVGVESGTKNKNQESKNNKDFDDNLKKNLSSNSLKLYDALSKDPKHVDVLSSQTGIAVRELLQSITELEINGLIMSYSGRRYSK